LPINHLLCENRRTAGRIGEDGLMTNQCGDPPGAPLQRLNNLVSEKLNLILLRAEDAGRAGSAF